MVAWPNRATSQQTEAAVREIIQQLLTLTARPDLPLSRAFDAYRHLGFLHLKLAAQYSTLLEKGGDTPTINARKQWRTNVDAALTNLLQARRLAEEALRPGATVGLPEERTWLAETNIQENLSYYFAMANQEMWTLTGDPAYRQRAEEEWGKVGALTVKQRELLQPLFSQERQSLAAGEPSRSGRLADWDVAATGLAFLALLLGVVLAFKDRSRLVELVIRTCLAMAAGYAGVKLTGSLNADIVGKAATATGTVALVLILYFFNPAWVPRDDPHFQTKPPSPPPPPGPSAPQPPAAGPPATEPANPKTASP